MTPWTRRYLLVVSALLGLLGWNAVRHFLFGLDEMIRSHGGTRWELIQDDFPPWLALAVGATVVFVVVLVRPARSSTSLTDRLLTRVRGARLPKRVAVFGPPVLAVVALVMTFPLVGFILSWLMPIGFGALAGVGGLLFFLKGWLRRERSSVEGLDRVAARVVRLTVLTAAVFIPFGPLGLISVVRLDDVWTTYGIVLAGLALIGELAAFLVAAAAHLTDTSHLDHEGHPAPQAVRHDARTQAVALYCAAGPVALATVFWVDRLRTDHGLRPGLFVVGAAVLGLLLMTAAVLTDDGSEPSTG
ncbi:MAG: hypothetical protein AAF533_03880 [Acidobacteriota bacterium]